MTDSFTDEDRARLARIRELAVERDRLSVRADILARLNVWGMSQEQREAVSADAAEMDSAIVMLSRKMQAITRGEPE